MDSPTLLRETAVVYRCPFCRKSWRSQTKRIASRHLIHCFKRPDRVPYLGELSHRFMHEKEPWWPGAGKIWDGRQWQPVPGYEEVRGTYDWIGTWGDRWPDFGGKSLPDFKPWAIRLEILPHVCLDDLRARREPDEGGDEVDPLCGGVDDAAVIRAIHRNEP